MFEKIVAPLDGSAFAMSVIPHVVAMSQAMAAKVALLRVMVNEASTSTVISPVDWQLQKFEAQIYLEEITNRLAELIQERPDAVLLEGRAADRIIEYAQHSDCDLVALSSHGQGGLNGWNVSSVAQKVIHRVNKSILLVRAYQMDVENQLGTWAGLRYRRIIVPLDGSPRAEHILPIATALAAWHQAELLLVHVVTYPTMFQRMPLTAEERSLAKQLFDRNQTQANKYFDQLRSRLMPEPQTHIITGDNILATLHNFVNQQAADLIILSAHGHSAQSQWPYGSLVTSFIEYGSTSLLILQDMPPNAIEPTAAELATEAIKKREARPAGGSGHLPINNEIQVQNYAPTAI